MNVFCVKWGDKYDRSFVERLRESLKRNLTGDWKFYCYTDKPEKDYDIPVEYPELRKWWHKLALLKFKGENLYFDLDIQINGNIDFLKKDFGTLTLIDSTPWKTEQDELKFKYNRDTLVNSSIMRWEDQGYIFDKFLSNRNTYLRLYSGIDRWIYNEKIDYKYYDTDKISSWIEKKDNVIVIENGKYINK